MSETVQDELVEDAEIEGLRSGSGVGSFLKGSLLGVLVSGAVLLGLTLNHPLPGNLPGIGSVQVELGSEDAGVQVEANTTGEADAADLDVETTISQVADGSTTDTEQASSVTESVADAAGASGSGDEAGTEPLSGTSSNEVVVGQVAEPSPPEAMTEEGTELAAVTPAADTPEAETPDTPQVVAVPELNLPGPALSVNASDVVVPDNVPLLAIVLEDALNGTVKADGLDLWPFKVALAIAPDGSGATLLSQAARAANHEVLVELPFAQSDADIGAAALHAGLAPEALTTLTQRNVAALPDALGVVVPEDASILGDRAALGAVLAPLQEYGFAWIDPLAGSGSVVPALAEASDLVHTATNRIVPAGSSTEQVLNGLKSAAFTARQRGDAIVRIAASEQALSALLTFALENGDNTFRIAPVSAVLKRRAAE